MRIMCEPPVVLMSSHTWMQELFTQAGPVASVYIPKDRVTNENNGYGFVEMKSERDADYAAKVRPQNSHSTLHNISDETCDLLGIFLDSQVMNMVKLFEKPLKVNKSSPERQGPQDVGANLFVGNLDPDVDEKLLYDTFSAFGVILGQPKVMRDIETGDWCSTCPVCSAI